VRFTQQRRAGNIHLQHRRIVATKPLSAVRVMLYFT
jgi:hypothetical protein